MTFHISINDNKSVIRREYHEGIAFDRPYEVGLKSFVTYNSVYNITDKNNRYVFVYQEEPEGKEELVVHEVVPLKPTVKDTPAKPRSRRDLGVVELYKTNEQGKTEVEAPYYLDLNEGITPEMDEQMTNAEATKTGVKKKPKTIRKEHKVPPGIYELAEIGNYIESTVPDKKVFWMIANKNSLKVELGGDIGIDFSSPSSIGPTLGFERKVYRKGGNYASTRVVDLFPINMIRVRCNLVKSNVEDTRLNDDAVYEFPLKAQAGEKIVERPSTTTFYRVNTDILHDLHLKIVDQDNRLVDFRGERLNILLEFRPSI